MWVTALGACDSRARIETVHPTRANLRGMGGAAVLLPDSFPTGLSPAELSEWTRTRNWFVGARTTLRIGKLAVNGGEGPEVFGVIWDVEMDQAGNIYVLDIDNYQVRIFDSVGRYVEGFGGPGNGPEQFRAPKGIELLDDGRLVVADRGNQLKVFVKSPEGYSRTETIRVPLAPVGLCSIRDRIFVSARSNLGDAIVHEVATRQGRSHRSFGNGYKADNDLARGQLSDGLVACTAYPARVSFAFSLFPLVRGYDADDGELLWAARMKEYAQMGITEHRYPNGRSAIRFSHEGVVENLVLMHGISSKHFLMQTGRGVRPGQDDLPTDPEIRTYLVDAATGNGALVSDSLPMIMAADSIRHVAVWLTPYPRLEVRTSGPETRRSRP